jgi:hypothetical protein
MVIEPRPLPKFSIETPMNTRIFSAFLIVLILLLSPFTAQSQTTLTVEGPDESRPFTLVDSSLLEILATGDVIARVNEDVACPDETGPCDSCCPTPPACDSCCPTCQECICETNLSFSQFQISAGGNNYGNGQSFTINAGDPIQATWKAPGAFVCTATGLPGTNNWNNHSKEAFSGGTITVGTSNVTPSATPYTMRLTCENGPSTTLARQVSVTVAMPPEQPSECQGVPSLQQASGGRLVRAQDVVLDENSNGYEYASVFGAQFPGQGTQRQFRLVPDTYASMRFTVPSNLNSNHTGSWSFEVLAGTNSGNRLVSISKCQGDFNPANLEPGCIRPLTGGDGFFWRHPGHSQTWRCPVEPGEEYYLNVIYSMDQPGTPMTEIDWFCTSALRCGNLMMPGHNYSP